MSKKHRDPFRVMLVEDEEDFRRILAGLLLAKFPSMMLEEAADGKEAIERMPDCLPDLVFMDINLPGENGLKVTRRIKALFPDTKVVILTNYDFPEYREAARACGAYQFLSKGICTAEEIEDLVKGLYEKRGPAP
jgi:DNA-binding NarL/FixJ family response regulator